MQCRALSHVDENLRVYRVIGQKNHPTDPNTGVRIKVPQRWQAPSSRTTLIVTGTLLARGAKHQINIPCTISPPKPSIYPRHPNYTTPTPSFPILGDFPTFAPNFERDFCIRTPIFRWTPLPEAIPSRRISPIFSHFPPTLTDLPHLQHPILYRSYIPSQFTHTPYVTEISSLCQDK